MVTHNSEAAEATDRMITLQDGRIGSDELVGGPGVRPAFRDKCRREPAARVQPA